VADARAFTTRDYRLFDIRHAVLPTKLPLHCFYEELVDTQHQPPEVRRASASAR